MTSYIRFFHIESHHLSFLSIEFLVTFALLLFFVLLPVRYLAFYPNRPFRRVARRKIRACVVVFLLSFFGRIALLPVEPFQTEHITDEHSYLIAADTFAHGRLTNATPPYWHHFENFHVLMQPTYTSKYGAAGPMFIAIGQRFLGSPRAGVMLSMALAAAALVWMLQAYLPSDWALLGGLLAVIRMSWFSYYGNSYWGGSVAMLGGCLLLGASVRLLRKPRCWQGLLMATGLLLMLNSRPFEGALLSLPICCHLLWTLARRRGKLRVLLPGLGLLFVGVVCTGYYCHRVTGRLTFPWIAYWQQAGMCPPFMFEKPNYSVHYLFPEQYQYNRYADLSGWTDARTLRGVVRQTIFKGIFLWLFFIGPALTLLLPGLIPTLRARKSRVLMWSLGLASVGFLCETYLQSHYFAVATGVVYLVLINSMRWMYVGARHDIVWLKLLRGTLATVTVMALVRIVIVPLNQFPPYWASLSDQTPAYDDVHEILASKPGKQLVIIRYRPEHSWAAGWINNLSDLPSQQTIWARDTEPIESNVPLLCSFRDRQAWLLVPPEEGFLRPPDRTAPWNPHEADQFLRPYTSTEPLNCPASR